MTEPLERLSPEAMTELARQIVTNQVYAAWDSEMLRHSFGGFLQLVAAGRQEQGEDVSWMNEIGLIYEDMNKSGYHGSNGYPMFMSAKFLHRDDRTPLLREVLRMQLALGAITQQQLDDFDEAVAEIEHQPEAE